MCMTMSSLLEIVIVTLGLRYVRSTKILPPWLLIGTTLYVYGHVQCREPKNVNYEDERAIVGLSLLVHVCRALYQKIPLFSGL